MWMTLGRKVIRVDLDFMTLPLQMPNKPERQVHGRLQQLTQYYVSTESSEILKLDEEVKITKELPNELIEAQG